MAKTYSVDVVGYTWAGYKSAYSYNGFDHVPADAEIKSTAGDFQSVTDYRISSTETTVTYKGRETSTMIKHNIITDWTESDSEMCFDDCMGE